MADPCTMCGGSIEKVNEMVKTVAQEAPADHRYVLEWYAREPRTVCMECYISCTH